MSSPFILPGGSFTFQISEEGLTPAEYRALQSLKVAMDRWARQVGLVVNSNQAIGGITTARPSASSLAALPNGGAGYMWWDYTIGKPVWWNGGSWRDATGAIA